MNKRVIVAGALLLVVLSGLGGFFISKNDKSSSVTEVRNADDYPLLARRIFIESPNDPIINFATLRKSLNDYFTEKGLKGSLYFEYLPTGTSIRIAGEEKEVAASLIKLPAAMELYKAVELGKVNLDTTVELKPEWLDGGFGNLYKKGAGYKLTIREAVKIMLQDSDNTALKVVSAAMLGNVPQEENPFNFLDAEIKQNNDLTVSIGARSYSSFLKCLYFSCYLSKENSQEILGHLSNSDFDKRMVAGTSSDVVVAHKVGNFAQSTQSDCGIVYLPLRNYLQCVMIEGPDNAETDAHIADLSKLSYEYLFSK